MSACVLMRCPLVCSSLLGSLQQETQLIAAAVEMLRPAVDCCGHEPDALVAVLPVLLQHEVLRLRIVLRCLRWRYWGKSSNWRSRKGVWSC